MMIMNGMMVVRQKVESPCYADDSCSLHIGKILYIPAALKIGIERHADLAHWWLIASSEIGLLMPRPWSNRPTLLFLPSSNSTPSTRTAPQVLTPKNIYLE